jgi:DNA-binding transcriptional regulator YhcF (GntR family)
VPPEYPTDRVERHLRQIVDALQPGERLPSYGQLASDLETTRATVSRAVQRLAAEGLVVILPNYGTFKAETD